MPEAGPEDVTGGRSRSRRRRKRRSWARRKHLGLITTLSVLVVLVAGVVLVVATWDTGRDSFDRRLAAAVSSAATAAPTQPTTAATPTPSASSAAPGSATTSTVRGTISTVGDDTWTLAGNNGLEYTIVVTGETTYAGRRSFGSFVVGDAVAVKGTLDQGTVTAQSITPITQSS